MAEPIDEDSHLFVASDTDPSQPPLPIDDEQRIDMLRVIMKGVEVSRFFGAMVFDTAPADDQVQLTDAQLIEFSFIARELLREAEGTIA